MKENKDPFGRALMDFFEGKASPIIIERDDGNLDVSGGAESYFRDYEEWDDYERQALSYARGRVLDVGCGAGRHSLYLQEQGHEVLALDNSPLAIEVARRRGVRELVVLPISRVSSKLGIFDDIIMMGNNFGLLANRKRARWLLRRFYHLTSKNARIIATSLDPYTTDDQLHLAYHRMNRERGRMSGQVRIRFRYRAIKGAWFDYLLVSVKEMREIIGDSGWSIGHIIPSDGPVFAAVLDKS